MGLEKYTSLILDKFTFLDRLIKRQQKAVSNALDFDDFDESEINLPELVFDNSIEYPDINLERINYINLSNSRYGHCLLYSAIESRDINRIYYLLQNGANPNRIEKGHNKNLLEYCICNEVGLDIIALLIDFGADINYVDSDGVGLLSYAILEGRDDIAKYLIQRGINLNQSGQKVFGDLPLTNALIYKKFGLVVYLLKSGANPNLHSEDKGETPFMTVCISGNVKLIDIFLSYGANLTLIDYKGWTVIDYVENSKIISDNEKLKIIEYLESKGVKKVNNIYAKPVGDMIRQALLDKDLEGLEKILQGDGLSETRTYFGTYTFLALETFDIRFLKLLLKYGANINRQFSMGNNLLGECFEKIRSCKDTQGSDHVFYVEAAKFLVSNGIDRFAKSHYTSIWAKAIFCGIEIFTQFFSPAELRNIKDNSGETPLYYACLRNDIDLVRLFISNGNNINYQEYEHGMTPLMVACFRNNFEIVKLLLENGAEINIRDFYGRNCLYYTFMRETSFPKDRVYTPDLKVLNLLLDSNVDCLIFDFQKSLQAIDCLYKYGFKDAYKLLKEKKGIQVDDIFDAILSDDLKRIKVLLNDYNNLKKRDFEGMTVLHCALKNGNKEIYDYVFECFEKNDLTIPNMKHLYLILIGIGDVNLLIKFLEKETLSDNIIIILSYVMYLGKIELIEIVIQRGYSLTGSYNWLNGYFYDIYENTIKTELDGGVMLEKVNEGKFESDEYRKITNCYGFTPLIVAVELGNIDFVKLLIERYGVDVNGEQSQWIDGGYEKYGGRIPLMIAVRNQNYEIAEYLLSKGADPNKYDYQEHDSVLHFVRSGDHKMYELLQRYGLYGYSTNRDGNKPCYLRDKENVGKKK